MQTGRDLSSEQLGPLPLKQEWPSIIVGLMGLAAVAAVTLWLF